MQVFQWLVSTRNFQVAVRFSLPSLASNLEQVANLLCAQANSASYPSKRTPTLSIVTRRRITRFQWFCYEYSWQTGHQTITQVPSHPICVLHHLGKM